MKVHIPNDSKQTLGGGWSFIRNFKKGLSQIDGNSYVEDTDEADVFLIASPTMITKETFNKLKETGKKIIVRIDNAPRNSRNRNTGSFRLKKFGMQADGVIYQSIWARRYLQDFIEAREYRVIYNGVDTDIFNLNGPKEQFDGSPVYLYSRYNRDETKRWEDVWYRWQFISRRKKKKGENPLLVLVGQFTPELHEYNFDFFMDERYDFWGVVEDPFVMSKIYRGCDWLFAPYFMDAYSNTYLEALACGCKLYKPNLSGGTGELIHQETKDLKTMVADYLQFFSDVKKK